MSASNEAGSVLQVVGVGLEPDLLQFPSDFCASGCFRATLSAQASGSVLLMETGQLSVENHSQAGNRP